MRAGRNPSRSLQLDLITNFQLFLPGEVTLGQEHRADSIINRIVRASTRLGTFERGEMSEYYMGKILPTDVALAALGITMPDEIVYEGQTYVRASNERPGRLAHRDGGRRRKN